MLFAPFTGVNHHRQSNLFGGALLKDKIVDTFVCLFKQFRLACFLEHTTAIITDQYDAMENAIRQSFPESHHHFCTWCRFCKWHVKKHDTEYLQCYRVRYEDFDEFYKSWIRSDTIEEFEMVGNYYIRSIKSLRSVDGQCTRSSGSGYYATWKDVFFC